MQVEDLDISPSKIADTAQRIIDRAIEEARRREHVLLTNEHLFLAFAQVEWDTFAEVMRDVELNPHTILQAIEEHLHMMPSLAGRDLRISSQTGSGKTLAIGFALRDVLGERAESKRGLARPRALVIVPTRELARQVQDELSWLYRPLTLRIAATVVGIRISSR